MGTAVLCEPLTSVNHSARADGEGCSISAALQPVQTASLLKLLYTTLGLRPG